MDDYEYLTRQPLLLEFNRVERIYTGGTLLNRWQGIRPEVDSNNSEEFLVSTIEYIGRKKDLPSKGISRIKLPDNSFVTLKELVDAYPENMLGEDYAFLCGGHSGIQARICDSAVRLVIQAHPTGEMARKHFSAPAGKTEVWYVLDSREINGEKPYIYAGFKDGVTREYWKELFLGQDIDTMLDCLHKIDVKNGDTAVIEAGMPHAMGPGCLILEMHEPCDYTIRLERNYQGQPLSDEEMHYGLGFDTVLDFFNYKTYSREEVLRKVMVPSRFVSGNSAGTLSNLFTYDDTSRFRAEKLILTGLFDLPPFRGHRMLAGAKGNILVHYNGGSAVLPQGHGMFLPAAAGNISVEGDGELIIGYPFKLE